MLVNFLIVVILLVFCEGAVLYHSTRTVNPSYRQRYYHRSVVPSSKINRHSRVRTYALESEKRKLVSDFIDSVKDPEPFIISTEEINQAIDYRTKLAKEFPIKKLVPLRPVLEKVPDIIQLHEKAVEAIQKLSWAEKENFTKFQEIYDGINGPDGFKPIGLASNYITDMQIFFFYENKNSRLIAIAPGTKSVENVLLDCILIPIKDQYERGLTADVPLGFLSAYQSIRDQFILQIKEYADDYDVSEIVLFGYSLGAAVSSLALYDLLENETNFVTQTNFVSITFACPDIGTEKFISAVKQNLAQAKYLAERNDKTLAVLNFAHPDDVVALGYIYRLNLMHEYKRPIGDKIYLLDPASRDISHHILVSQDPHTGYLKSYLRFLDRLNDTY